MTIATTVPSNPRPRVLLPRRPNISALRLGIDRNYTWADDVHIVEISTGRVFHRDLWATRGR